MPAHWHTQVFKTVSVVRFYIFNCTHFVQLNEYKRVVYNESLSLKENMKGFINTTNYIKLKILRFRRKPHENHLNSGPILIFED